MKKLSINDFERICKANSGENVNDVTFQVDDDKSITIQVKRVLSFKNRILFVSEVVENCFDNDGEFIPAVSNMAFKIAVLKYFTNFTLPENPSKTYNLLAYCDIYSQIIQHINPTEVSELCNEIKSAIDYRKEKAIAMQKAELMKISNTMNAITEQFSKTFEGMDVQEFIDEVSTFNDNIAEVGANTATLSVIGGKSGV